MTLFDPHAKAKASAAAKSPPSAGKVLTLQFDGGSRGNPGPAGLGVTVAGENGKPLYELGEYIGRCTSNVAEYRALCRGVEAAVALGAEKLMVKADSELVVRQLNGIYKVKSPGLKPLFQQALNLMRQIKDVRVTHVYREANSRADQLANMAMDREAKIEPLGPLADKK